MEIGEYKVWQRVLEEPGQEAIGEALHRMAQQSRRALLDYRALAEHRRAGTDNGARKLEQWERENLEVLLGLFRLSTGKTMGTEGKMCLAYQKPEYTFLYRRALEQLQEYTAMSAQPHYGVVFGEMAGRQRRICEGIARAVSTRTGR